MLNLFSRFQQWSSRRLYQAQKLDIGRKERQLRVQLQREPMTSGQFSFLNNFDQVINLDQLFLPSFSQNIKRFKASISIVNQLERLALVQNIEVNKSLQMTQKFILTAEKTAKKGKFFEEEKPKKFTRKRSDRDKSVDSKRSREGSFNSQYIKNKADISSICISRIQDEASNFVDKFNHSLILDLQAQTKSRNTMYTRTNTNRQRGRDENALYLRIEMLETQQRVKQGECDRLRLQLDQQRQRRRKSQSQKRSIIKEIQELQKTNEKMSIENKKLRKEKQYLLKQVQFLQKINYDEKTRQIQSFREKYIAAELQKVRQQLKLKRTVKEKELQTQCNELRHQLSNSQEKFKSMKSLVEVLKGKIDRLQVELSQFKQLSKEKILSSPQYMEIKERYRRFIETYKQIRAQNWNLRNIIEGKETDLILSDSDQQAYL